MANEVYDPETDDSTDGSSTYSRPDLGPGHNTPSGKPSDPRSENAAAGDASDPRGKDEDSLDRSGLQQAESGADSGFYNPNDSSHTSPSGLKDSEDEAGDHFSSGFENQTRPSRRKKVGGFVRKNKFKLGIAGAIGGGGIASLFVAMFLLIPLKIEHIVTNLQNRFTSPATSAVEGTNHILLKRYISKFVLPDYKNCGTTRDRHCKVRVITGRDNPVRNLYQSWAQTRLENKLADKYAIEFKFDKHSNSWRLKGPGTARDGDNIGRDGEKMDNVFTSRKQLLNASLKAMEDETRWKKVMYRFKIGRLLSQKYGLKRCIFFCGTRKTIKAPIRDAKQAAKLILAERVLKPRSETTFVAVKCILDPNCHPDHTTAEGEKPPISETEQQQREKLKALADEYGIKDFDKLTKIHAELSDRGFQKYLTDQIFQKIVGKEISTKISDAIPIVGWINLAAEFVNGANDAGPKIKKLSYITNAAAAVQLYMAYRTYADEIHTGKVDPVEVGSLVDSLGTGKDNKNDPIVGGTAGAEQAPLYSNLVNGEGSATPTTTASLLSSFLPGKAYAATAQSSGESSNYKCNNDKTPPKHQLCSEEILGQGNEIANSVHEFLNLPGLNAITAIAGVWKDIFGPIFDLANSVISPVAEGAQTALDAGCSVSFNALGVEVHPVEPLPGYCGIRAAVKDVAPDIIKGITTVLIPSPFGSNMGGGRTFTMMAGGANVSGNDACEQIGCQAVSPSTVAAIINQQQVEAREQFARQPLFARLFNTDSSYSLVSQVTMATPLNLRGSAQTGFASLLSSPFGALAHGFGAVFSSGQAAAAPVQNPDPFKIGTTAFPKNKIPQDPEKYWDEHNCGDTSENGPIPKWQKEAADGPTNPNTGMPVHRNVEPCLLILEATGTSGAVYDSSHLTKDDLAEVNPGGNNNSNSSGEISGNAVDLAKKILANHKITYLQDSDGDAKKPIEETAAGKCAHTKEDKCVAINIKVLQTIADAGSQFAFRLHATVDGGHHAGSSHYYGVAMDTDPEHGPAIAKIAASKYSAKWTGGSCAGVGGTGIVPDGGDHCHIGFGKAGLGP